MVLFASGVQLFPVVNGAPNVAVGFLPSAFVAVAGHSLNGDYAIKSKVINGLCQLPHVDIPYFQEFM